MTSFAHQLAPAKKSPTSTVNPDGRGNGQPDQQQRVGDAVRAFDDGIGYFAVQGDADRLKLQERADA